MSSEGFVFEGFEEQPFFSKVKEKYKKAQEMPEWMEEGLRPLAYGAAQIGEKVVGTPRSLEKAPFDVGSLIERTFGSKDPYSEKAAHFLNLDVPSAPEAAIQKRVKERLGEPETGAEELGQQYGSNVGSLMQMLLDPKKAIAGAGMQTAVQKLPLEGSAFEGLKPFLEMGATMPFMIEKPEPQRLSSIFTKEKKALAQLGEKYGLTEEEISVLSKSDKEQSFLRFLTSGGKKISEVSKNIGNKLIKAKDDILGSIFTGYKEGGSQGVEEAANAAYANMIETAKKYEAVPINPRGIKMAIGKTVNKLEKIKGRAPETNAFLNYLKYTYEEVSSGKMSMADMIESYQEMNKTWKSSNTAKVYIDNIKNAVKNNIRKVKVGKNKIGEALANDFEAANFGYQQSKDYENIAKKLSPIFTESGADFGKLGNLLDREENINLFQDVLGKEATNNLKEMAQIGEKAQDVAAFFAESKNAHLLGAGGEAVAVFLTAFSGHPVAAGGMIGTHAVLNSIGKKLLFDPKYQRLWLQTVNALKNSKFDLAKTLAAKAIRDSQSESQKTDYQ
jgi:uncharacterized protein (DUF1499 family)